MYNSTRLNNVCTTRRFKKRNWVAFMIIVNILVIFEKGGHERHAYRNQDITRVYFGLNNIIHSEI